VGGLPECFSPVTHPLLQNLLAWVWIFALRLGFLNFCISSCHSCLYDSLHYFALMIATLSSAIGILLDYPEKENKWLQLNKNEWRLYDHWCFFEQTIDLC